MKKQLAVGKFKLASMILASCIFNIVYAQEEKSFIHHGNKDYERGKYDDAEKNYKKAVEKNSNSLKGTFNMADALYKQGRFAEAGGLFESITNRKTTSDTLSKAYHNLGNSLLRQKKYEESVDAYKKALKNNPDDDETRYNLAYALSKIKLEQQQQKQNKDDKKDQKKDQQQQQQKQDEKKDQKQEQQQQQNKISPEDAKRLLEALNNDEKKTQEKLKKQKAKGAKSDIEKDW